MLLQCHIIHCIQLQKDLAFAKYMHPCRMRLMPAVSRGVILETIFHETACKFEVI